MEPTRYDPLNTLRRFQDEINRMFGDDVRPGPGDDRSQVATSAWSPAVDIKEEGERYVIAADLPGVQPEDIEITMEGGILTLKGQRRPDAPAEGEVFRRVERVFGTFYRRFTMPDAADPDGVSASSAHGVLQVVIPKKQAVQPRRIEVT